MGSTLPACLWRLLSHHPQCIRHLHLLRVTILILGRPTWGATVSTRTPTATWSRRWCSRTNASLTQRELATHRTRSPVLPNPSETARVSLKLMSSELVCDLVEAIHYETLEETYQVQRCFTGKDRVCDTTYKIDMTTKDDYQCTNVETPNCYMEEKVINDVTCTNSWSSTVRGIRAPRMMAMVPRELCAIGSQHRVVTTFLERSKLKFARLTCIGTARSSPTSFLSQWRSRTA